MSYTHIELKKATLKSQHCQRNWDLSKQIPEADLDVLLNAVTQCPSKQNIAFYKIHFVTNRSLIEKIHDATDGFTISYEPLKTTTNTQVLANLLVVFEEADLRLDEKSAIHRNQQTKAVYDKNNLEFQSASDVLSTDKLLATGVASGYLNLTASLLGYSTGCCTCFDPGQVKSILGLKNKPILMMGVGFKSDTIGRRVHHTDNSFVFPTKTKQKIEVEIVS